MCGLPGGASRVLGDKTVASRPAAGRSGLGGTPVGRKAPQTARKARERNPHSNRNPPPSEKGKVRSTV